MHIAASFKMYKSTTSISNELHAKTLKHHMLYTGNGLTPEELNILAAKY